MEKKQEAQDVLPPRLNLVLALLWLLLFGGRWLLVPLLLYAGLVSAPDVARWDGGVLLQLYLVLLVITVLIMALRAVRGVQSARPPSVPAPGSRSSIRRDDPRD